MSRTGRLFLCAFSEGAIPPSAKTTEYLDEAVSCFHLSHGEIRVAGVLVTTIARLAKTSQVDDDSKLITASAAVFFVDVSGWQSKG